MSVYDFLDYRDYVRAWLQAHPKRSQAWAARRIGISKAAMSMALGGTRDLPLTKATALGRLLGLHGDDLAYFEALVRCAHGPSLEIRHAAGRIARALRDFAHVRPPDPAHHGWFGSWVHLAVLGLAHLDGFEATPDWAAARLWPQVDRDRVEQAVRDLVDGGVLVQVDGAWTVDKRPLGTAQRVSDPTLGRALLRLHQDELEHASRALDTFGADQRLVASLMVPIRADAMPELVRTANRMHLELIEPFRAPDRADGLVQIVIAVYPRAVPA